MNYYILTIRMDQNNDQGILHTVTGIVRIITSTIFSTISIIFALSGKKYVQIFNKLVYFENKVTKLYGKNKINYNLLKWNLMIDATILIIDFLWIMWNMKNIKTFNLDVLTYISFLIEKYFPFIGVAILNSILLIISALLRYLRTYKIHEVHTYK